MVETLWGTLKYESCVEFQFILIKKRIWYNFLLIKKNPKKSEPWVKAIKKEERINVNSKCKNLAWKYCFALSFSLQ